jgi:hypothetical protein
MRCRTNSADGVAARTGPRINRAIKKRSGLGLATERLFWT